MPPGLGAPGVPRGIRWVGGSVSFRNRAAVASFRFLCRPDYVDHFTATIPGGRSMRVPAQLPGHAKRRRSALPRHREPSFELEQFVLDDQDELITLVRVMFPRALHLEGQPIHRPPQPLDFAFERFDLFPIPLVFVCQFPKQTR